MYVINASSTLCLKRTGSLLHFEIILTNMVLMLFENATEVQFLRHCVNPVRWYILARHYL